LSLAKSPGKGTTLNSFQAVGKNLTDSPIENIKAYIRSDITNIVLPVLFYVGTPALVAPQDTHGIPAHAEFKIRSENINTIFPNQPIQVPIELFLKDFSAFTFVFEY